MTKTYTIRVTEPGQAWGQTHTVVAATAEDALVLGCNWVRDTLLSDGMAANYYDDPADMPEEPEVSVTVFASLIDEEEDGEAQEKITCALGL